MRIAPVIALVLVTACGGTERSVAVSDATPARSGIDDLTFLEPQLDAVAQRLVAEARARGVDVEPEGSKVDRLLALEAKLGAPAAAQTRVNMLVYQLTATDTSDWARLRGRAGRIDSERVRELLDDWSRRKAQVVNEGLSDTQRRGFGAREWEAAFHEFIRRRPMHAGTWGWLVLREHGAEIRQQYGRVDSETAYRFYLDINGLGTATEARDLFSVPGVEME